MGSEADRLEGDFELYKLANQRGKFAIGMWAVFSATQLEAFERGIDAEYFWLVDVAPIATGSLVSLEFCRVFKLTEAGEERRAAAFSHKQIDLAEFLKGKG